MFQTLPMKVIIKGGIFYGTFRRESDNYNWSC